MVWRLLVAGLLVYAGSALGQTGKIGPYDATADAQAELDAARALARQGDRYLLVLFGANWCPDCRAFDAALRGSEVAPLIAEHFVVTKVDVGNWDRNFDIVESWGDPIAGGIPAIVVTTSDGTVFYTSKAGELSRARDMDGAAMVDVFEHLLELGRAAERSASRGAR